MNNKGFRYSNDMCNWMKNKADNMLVLEENRGLTCDKLVQKYNLDENFNKTFNLNKTRHAISMLLMKFTDPERYLKYSGRDINGKPINKKNLQKGDNDSVFTKATYIMYLQNNVLGFDTKDEIIEFLKMNRVLAPNVSIFVRKELKIDYQVDII